MILPNHVGRKFLMHPTIHNGKEYLPILISEQMVNHKLGEAEFAPTQKPYKRAHSLS
ncbi:hypothetical protein CcCBS67573_g06440 [Chytriomyces confervae]|uniref:Uncharacterized protein n=1 Tax=Chytriomyces confervae TaxID=246404 RepID=A0A507F4Y5_9FUNG|nr:hypothetical protein CcCBS67573_g06440 [Chytriomyces confervae]